MNLDHFRKALADRRGLSALELAAVMPIMATVLMSTIDLGGAIQQSIRLEAAARAGAQYAMFTPTDETGTVNAVKAALPGWTNVTVATPTYTCRCPGTGTVSCTSTTCASPLQRFVTISVTRPFTTILFQGLSPLRGDIVARIR